jgi:hypothetical protein
MWDHMLLWTLRNQLAPAWSAGVEPAQTPQLALLAAFSVPRPGAIRSRTACHC